MTNKNSKRIIKTNYPCSITHVLLKYKRHTQTHKCSKIIFTRVFGVPDTTKSFISEEITYSQTAWNLNTSYEWTDIFE